MGSVGALGIGLSIVFGVFLVLLLAELYYLLFWKRKSPISSSRVTSASVAPNDPARVDGGGGLGTSEMAFVAKMLESSMIGSEGGEFVLAPPRLLFTIKEEAREDLFDSAEDALKSSSIRRDAAAANPHVVVELLQPEVPDVRERVRDGLLHVCSSSSCEEESSSSDAEIHRASSTALEIEDVISTPFVTPPSSPGFSTPPASPRPWPIPPPKRSVAADRSYESPPSPPLLPMPVPSAASVTGDHGFMPASASSSWDSCAAKRSGRSP